MMKKNIEITNRFNLIDEPWIPVADAGLVSLKEIFSNSKYTALGGNPIQKISIMKLLLAIVQSASTPKDDNDWAKLGADGMAKKAIEYLNKHRVCFWLYGEKPFLQMTAIKKAEIKSCGALLPEIATGNTTVLKNTQIENFFNDHERALLVVQLMGFGLGGKKTDNNVVLTKNYKGKSPTGKPGTSIGHMGFLHSFLIGNSLQETLWLNLVTSEQIKEMKYFTSGIGKPPWEVMPSGESDAIAKEIQSSMVGRLVPLSRFVLLTSSGIHYSEGIPHMGYKDGIFDPSMTVSFSGKKPKAIWTDPEKRPWRQLPAMLSFFESGCTDMYTCQNIQQLKRARKKLKKIGIWSGGLRVSSNAGEQYVSGLNDFVESEIFFDSSWLGEIWFTKFKSEMGELDLLSKMIYSTVIHYYKTLQSNGKKQAEKATGLFWQLCERKAQELVDACIDDDKLKSLRHTFAGYVNEAYNRYCPNDTARQIDAWAKNRPNLGKYLSSNKQEGGSM